MREEIIKKLEIPTEEEKHILSGESKQVVWDIYATNGKSYVEATKMLKKGQYMNIRKHTRFIDFPEHGHNYIEIFYVCRGTIVNWLEGERIVMEEGDILFLNQFAKHSIEKCGEHDIGINFMVLPEFFDVPLRMLNSDNILADFLISVLKSNETTAKYLHFKLGHELTVSNLMENIVVSMLLGEQNYEMINQYSVGLIFLYIVNHIETVAHQATLSYQEILLQTTMRYIDIHYKEASLSHLANETGQSLSVLSRMIKQETGKTFKELLQEKRFEEVRNMLSQTDLSIADIMVACGYENSSYFYRKFKEKYGVSPKEYRKLHKEEN